MLACANGMADAINRHTAKKMLCHLIRTSRLILHQPALARLLIVSPVVKLLPSALLLLLLLWGWPRPWHR